MSHCLNMNCNNEVVPGTGWCLVHAAPAQPRMWKSPTQTMSAKYPKYYKDVTNITEVDVYTVHKLFNIQDPSGCIQHASKKLLLSGVRTGGKSMFKDISEARDTLERWLQLNSATSND